MTRIDDVVADRRGWRAMLAPLERVSEGRAWGYYLLLPSLFLVLAVVLYPTLWGMVLSFREMRLNRIDLGTGFVGLRHYADLIDDPIFWLSLKNTVIWVVGAVVAELALGSPPPRWCSAASCRASSSSACWCCCRGSCPTSWPATCGR